ncbi:MAG: hypothetical protein LBI10_05745 [Deltaproteobacteria bacterium]|nr:hypothetical protein [Deltaproteobacteria bacterium]
MSQNDLPAQVTINAPSANSVVLVKIYPPDATLNINVTSEGDALEVKVCPRGRRVEVKVGSAKDEPEEDLTRKIEPPPDLKASPPSSLDSGSSAADSALVVEATDINIVDDVDLESLSSATAVYDDAVLPSIEPGPVTADLEADEELAASDEEIAISGEVAADLEADFEPGSSLTESIETPIDDPSVPVVYRDRDGTPPPVVVLESLAQLAEPEPAPIRDDPKADTDLLIAPPFGPPYGPLAGEPNESSLDSQEELPEDPALNSASLASLSDSLSLESLDNQREDSPDLNLKDLERPLDDESETSYPEDPSLDDDPNSGLALDPADLPETALMESSLIAAVLGGTTINEPLDAEFALDGAELDDSKGPPPSNQPPLSSSAASSPSLIEPVLAASSLIDDPSLALGSVEAQSDQPAPNGLAFEPEDTNFDQANAERFATEENELKEPKEPVTSDPATSELQASELQASEPQASEPQASGRLAPDTSTAVIVNYLEDAEDSFFEFEGQASVLTEEEDLDIDLLDPVSTVGVLAAKPMVPAVRKAINVLTD